MDDKKKRSSRAAAAGLLLSLAYAVAAAAPSPTDAGGLPEYPAPAEGKVITMPRAYPSQPSTSERQLMEAESETPFVVTRPMPRQDKYRARAGVKAYGCKERADAGQLRFARKNHFQSQADELLKADGKCHAVGFKNFKVSRFEAYNAPIGHFEVAYAERTVRMKTADGKPYGVPERFYILRDEIERVIP